jgi:hypothetical protein
MQSDYGTYAVIIRPLCAIEKVADTAPFKKNSCVVAILWF